MSYGELASKNTDMNYILDQCGQDLLLIVEKMEIYFKKRGMAEESYMAALKTLQKNIEQKTLSGSLNNLLLPLSVFDKDETKTSRQKQTELSSLVLERLKETSRQYKQERNAQIVEIKSAIKAWKNTSKDVEAASKRNKAARKEADDSKNKYEKADKDLNVTKAYVLKTQNEYKAKEETAQKTQREYEKEVERTREEYQRHFFETLPTEFNRLQKIDTKLLGTIKATMTDYVALIETATTETKVASSALAEQIKEIDPVEEIKKFTAKLVGMEKSIEFPVKETTKETAKQKTMMARALYDFIPENPRDELQLTTGELLEIKDKSDDWWLAKNKKGEVGYIPFNYVEEIE